MVAFSLTDDNPVVALLRGADSRTEAVADRELKAIDRANTQEWPNAPYHHGMGRIREYELWRNALPDEEREAEVAAAQLRFKEYNRQRAIALFERMTALGFELPGHVIPGYGDPAPDSGRSQAQVIPSGAHTAAPEIRPSRNPIKRHKDGGPAPDVR